MLSRDDGDPLHWQEVRVLRQQLRGRFHDVCEAVAELRKKTIRASSLVETLNSRLRGYFCRRRQWGADDLSHCSSSSITGRWRGAIALSTREKLPLNC